MTDGGKRVEIHLWHVAIAGAAVACIAGLIALVNAPARGAPIRLISAPTATLELAPSPTPIPLTTAGPPSPAIQFPLNINTATLAELQSLPGIGPSLAAAIISHRETHGPFTVIEQIQNVAGIGPALFDGLRELITIE
jgi:competence ComEA-like helix-hairpin-helix protein